MAPQDMPKLTVACPACGAEIEFGPDVTACPSCAHEFTMAEFKTIMEENKPEGGGFGGPRGHGGPGGPRGHHGPGGHGGPGGMPPEGFDGEPPEGFEPPEGGAEQAPEADANAISEAADLLSGAVRV